MADRKYSIVDSLVLTICCPVGVCFGAAECRIEYLKNKLNFCRLIVWFKPKAHKGEGQVDQYSLHFVGGHGTHAWCDM